MFTWLRRFLGKKPARKAPGREKLTVFTGCLDCGCSEFYKGLQASLTMNITCANPHCGSRYNIVFFAGGPYLDMRIGSPHPLRKIDET